jgi:hypothetical protein
MNLIAIDPGTTQSAYVILHGMTPVRHGIVANEEMLLVLGDARVSEDAEDLVIEMVACYGMAVGKEVFETCVWIGRFIEAWRGPNITRVTRHQVKMHLCHSAKAKDGNVRQALLDMYGGATAVGKKASPGPLYGVHSDIWQALAVGVTYLQQQQKGV